MTARLQSKSTPAELMKALTTLGTAPQRYGLPPRIAELVHLRVSQINGCAWCLDYGVKNLEEAKISTTEFAQLPGWREATTFSEPERVALDLAERMTRMADTSDPVPDDVWNAAAEEFSEQELSLLITWIATTNLYNRINVTIRREPGTW
ncbi:carboxymuconolactone decarboxylase family protein [Microlunatus sp. Gsoil 973]|jgi:AhpD family alkylhydroperoxidase|uniref:carboxymuconolactone decarboxylase family protein n=1 Tax=Microlunatus sp. Gsoil 973 TaxID=2672569 RepID=UPI0012B49EED|nr:carboxymuconolactone decarboxylase family protein [Microlunatus sp. Gsoil 973]QGN33375.1 carboxymuconolactone decarboxylase family protein [Microlunatus sp. Gsoil 973]